MRTILVPTAGSATDEAVFQAALLIARPLHAHLEFIHVRIDACEAIANTPHAEFARGAALRACFDELDRRAERRSADAKQHFEGFCEREEISIISEPRAYPTVTASWSQEVNQAPERLLSHACHVDLVVAGRSRGHDGLPADLLDRLLLESGRPLLIPAARPVSTETALIAWNGSREANRAVGAALDLLARCATVLVYVQPETGRPAADIAELIAYLSWHGIAAKPVSGATSPLSIGTDLLDTAARERASLLVMGAYTHGRFRQMILGGVTSHVLHHATIPALLAH